MTSATTAPPILIFLHLPKTAGRTLSHVIEREYGRDAVLELYESTSRDELAALVGDAEARVRVVMGHLYFGVHTFLPRPASYVTLLRNPVDRVISHYYFVRTDPSHYLYDVARRLTLHEFVIFCAFDEPNNDQTRLLASCDYAANPGADPDEMLSLARRNLREYFAVVGLTEEFDRSLLLMQHLFGWRRPFYIRCNATRYRPQREEIPQATVEVIEAHNELDIELYDYANTLFNEQLRQLAVDIEPELRAFRALNRSYGKLVLTLSSTMARVMVRQ